MQYSTVHYYRCGLTDGVRSPAERASGVAHLQSHLDPEGLKSRQLVFGDVVRYLLRVGKGLVHQRDVYCGGGGGVKVADHQAEGERDPRGEAGSELSTATQHGLQVNDKVVS